MSGIGGGMSSSLAAYLTPYQVGLCCLLIQYAQQGLRLSAEAERRLFEVLLHRIQASRGLRQKALEDLRRELRSDPNGDILWEELYNRLAGMDSPDDLFNTFRELEAVIAREQTATSPLQAGGIFGQFARASILAFKNASFESVTKLYDAVRHYVEEFEIDHGLGEPLGTPRVANVDEGKVIVGAAQIEHLAQGLARDLPVKLGQVPFSETDKALAALRGRAPHCHSVDFLRYLNSSQFRMADEAARSLRSFHDGHQQKVLAELRNASSGSLGVPADNSGLPDLVQYAALAMAGLHSEMRHLDDALQAIDESIHAAQDVSDHGCLCACLHRLSMVLMHAGQTGKAFTMMRQCLHRAEALGLPTLQALCCLGIANALAVRPSLSDRRKRGLLWKESISRMAAEIPPPSAASRQQGGPGASANAGTNAGSGITIAARVFGSSSVVSSGGAGTGGGSRGGLSVLASLLGHNSRADTARGGMLGEPAGEIEGAACRDALAHVALASQLSTQARDLGEARPKVLLCQAEVARLFGWQPLTFVACHLALDVYRKDLVAEDCAVALCQLACAAGECSSEKERRLIRGIAQRLPHAGHLWAHILGPQMLHSLIRVGECDAASALLFQVAGSVRAAPVAASVDAAQRLRLAANSIRLYHRQFFCAYRSAREAVEAGACAGTPGDVCGHLLTLTDVHLEAQDFVGALAPCLRCLSAAQSSRLLHMRAEALVRLAKIRLEMRDPASALRITEDLTPELAASGSARLRGQALRVQADVLLTLAARPQVDDATLLRLLREVASTLSRAVVEFEGVEELNSLRHCFYLLARVHHQLGEEVLRDSYSARFRSCCDRLEGRGPRVDLGTDRAVQSATLLRRGDGQVSSRGPSAHDKGSGFADTLANAASGRISIANVLLEAAAASVIGNSGSASGSATNSVPTRAACAETVDESMEPPANHAAALGPPLSFGGPPLAGVFDPSSFDSETGVLSPNEQGRPRPCSDEEEGACPALSQLLGWAESLREDADGSIPDGSLSRGAGSPIAMLFEASPGGASACGQTWTSRRGPMTTQHGGHSTVLGNIGDVYPFATVLTG